jgi:hypothetical protein
MNQPRSEFDPKLNVLPLRGAGDGPVLSDDHIHGLLASPRKEQDSQEFPEAPPMAGVWLGVAIGLVLWAVLAGVVVLVRLS